MFEKLIVIIYWTRISKTKIPRKAENENFQKETQAKSLNGENFVVFNRKTFHGVWWKWKCKASLFVCWIQEWEREKNNKSHKNWKLFKYLAKSIERNSRLIPVWSRLDVNRTLLIKECVAVTTLLAKSVFPSSLLLSSRWWFSRDFAAEISEEARLVNSEKNIEAVWFFNGF